MSFLKMPQYDSQILWGRVTPGPHKCEWKKFIRNMCKKNILRLPRIQLDKTEKKSRNITKQIPQGAWLRRKCLSKAPAKQFTSSCDFSSPAFGIVCSYKTGYTIGRNNSEKKKYNNRPATTRPPSYWEPLLRHANITMHLHSIDR